MQVSLRVLIAPLTGMSTAAVSDPRQPAPPFPFALMNRSLGATAFLPPGQGDGIKTRFVEQCVLHTYELSPVGVRAGVHKGK